MAFGRGKAILLIIASEDRFTFYGQPLLLDSFVMVVDIGSIAETARRLNITAAGVAQRIRALETEIGTRLVVRSGQRVRPTEAGLAILARSRSILSDLRDLKPMAVADRPSGVLRLGATGSSTSGLLPSILALLTEKYPDVESQYDQR